MYSKNYFEKRGHINTNLKECFISSHQGALYRAGEVTTTKCTHLIILSKRDFEKGNFLAWKFTNR